MMTDKESLLLAEAYRQTVLTQAEVANLLGYKPSQVNTAISKHIPLEERRRLVAARKSNARRKCPNCGHLLR